MARNGVLAVILAGGEGNRLGLLTERRAKPAIPYAGVYRLIDFPLSNCMHSGISDVWVLQQYQPHSLSDHLSNGRPWDLDRTRGGLRILHPFQGTGEQSGFHEGNADALYRHKAFIEEFDPEVLLVLSSDHVYKLDYRSVMRRHRETGAAVTMVTTEVPIEEAGRFGTLRVDGDGRVRDFAYKPETPESGLVTTEVFAYDPPKLMEMLDELAERDDGGEGSALEDFGHGLLPSFVEDGNAYEHRLQGYWRDVGTVESYWQGHMDLLSPKPPLDLDDPMWPILTEAPQRTPALIAGSSRIVESLISPGCVVRGRVERSVLAPGVTVEEGAIVRDAVLLHDGVVEAGAEVTRAIVDTDARIGRGCRIGADGTAHDEAVEAEDIALIGSGAKLPEGTEVPAAGRVEPGSDDGRFTLADEQE